MGGIVSDSCNHLSKTIWYYCINRKVWLSAVHIPGKDNETAEYMSRLPNENTEWRLSPIGIVFHRILEVFYYQPEIDLFASCINYQIGQYMPLLHPDRNAIAIDPFSISWSELNFYAFPPPFRQPIRSSHSKSQEGEVFGDHYYTMVKNSFGFP